MLACKKTCNSRLQCTNQEHYFKHSHLLNELPTLLTMLRAIPNVFHPLHSRSLKLFQWNLAMFSPKTKANSLFPPPINAEMLSATTARKKGITKVNATSSNAIMVLLLPLQTTKSMPTSSPRLMSWWTRLKTSQKTERRAVAQLSTT